MFCLQRLCMTLPEHRTNGTRHGRRTLRTVLLLLTTSKCGRSADHHSIFYVGSVISVCISLFITVKRYLTLIYRTRFTFLIRLLFRVVIPFFLGVSVVLEYCQYRTIVP